jgi:hypothetical protein
VHGYRRVHRVARAGGSGARTGDGGSGGPGTEEMREAMVEARALFEDLVRPARYREESRKAAKSVESDRPDGGSEHARGEGRARQPWGFTGFTKRHAKGS